MKYFLDTEFVEGAQKKTILGIPYAETKPTIDLISIGIVAEDNREYYAISKEFNLKEAWNRYQIEPQTMYEKQNGYQGKKTYWLRENVLYPIFAELFQKENPEVWSEDFGNIGNFKGHFERYKNGFKVFKELLNIHGKTNKEITEDIFKFCTQDSLSIEKAKYYDVKYHNIEFYTYYGDYDWVAFCWLFGKMIDLPNGFPMYSKDLKQILDERIQRLSTKGYAKLYESIYNPSGNNPWCAPEKVSFNSKLKLYKEHQDYPKKENEHNALSDARWNKKLYEFLMST